MALIIKIDNMLSVDQEFWNDYNEINQGTYMVCFLVLGLF